MSPSARERAWFVALSVARRRSEREYLREFTPETVAIEAERSGVDVSDRTLRRALDSMVSLGVLDDVGSDGNRRFRLRDGEKPDSWRSSSDMTKDAVTSYHRDSDDGFLIYHLFADTGVESEPLSAYGRVARVGLEPRETPHSDAIGGDATTPPLRPGADLVVCHPPCGRWSPATRGNGDPEEWPNHIPAAREVARELGENYVIENVPGAVSAGELREDLRLDGRMFGLGIRYQRCFETSFPVSQPHLQTDLLDDSDPFGVECDDSDPFSGDKLLWRSAKQVSGDYPREDLIRSGIPAPYIHYIMRAFVRDQLETTSAPTAVAADGGEL